MKHLLLPTITIALLIGVYARTQFSNGRPETPNYLTVTQGVQGGVSPSGDASPHSEPTRASESGTVAANRNEPKVMGERTVQPNVAKMLDYIHLAESSRGKNDNPQALHNWCKRQGKSNEYGYGGMKLRICFDSHEEAQEKITDWLERHLVRFENDEAKTLCWYNLGEEEVNCKYYQTYLGIKIK